MQGSIRLIVGLILIAGSVSSFEHADKLLILELSAVLVFGFVSFFYGLTAFIKNIK